MSVLDWLFIGLLSGAILFGCLSVGFLLLGLLQRKQYRKQQQNRPKQKKKRKRWQKHCRSLKKRYSRQLKRSGLFFLLLLIFSGGSGYSRYYQLTNLDTNDGEIIVQSYFLIDEVEKELMSIQEGADAVKVHGKLREMSGMLVSYTSQTPSNALTKDGQQLLRRYYNRAMEFGLNLDSQSAESLNQEELLTGFLDDIERLQTEQQTIFKNFGINESALVQKK